jgi:hypothetical protein
MEVATAPKAIKTRLNPRINVAECNMTVPSIRRSVDWRSSTEAPEISDT